MSSETSRRYCTPALGLLTSAAALRLWGVRVPYASTIDALIPESRTR
jgi:hypothetical protein